MKQEKFQSCIDACNACAEACEICARESLHEKDVKMLIRCISLDRECAIACLAAAAMMTVGGEHATALCVTCAELCDACAEECSKHDMDHCRQCAQACRTCAEECRNMVSEHA